LIICLGCPALSTAESAVMGLADEFAIAVQLDLNLISISGRTGNMHWHSQIEEDRDIP